MGFCVVIIYVNWCAHNLSPHSIRPVFLWALSHFSCNNGISHIDDFILIWFRKYRNENYIERVALVLYKINLFDGSHVSLDNIGGSSIIYSDLRWSTHVFYSLLYIYNWLSIALNIESIQVWPRNTAWLTPRGSIWRGTQYWGLQVYTLHLKFDHSLRGQDVI